MTWFRKILRWLWNKDELDEIAAQLRLIHAELIALRIKQQPRPEGPFGPLEPLKPMSNKGLYYGPD